MQTSGIGTVTSSSRTGARSSAPSIMTRGNAQITKVHFKGNTDDFIVFVESAADVEKWKQDSSIPLAQVVNSFKIMITHKSVQGAPSTS